MQNIINIERRKKTGVVNSVRNHLAEMIVNPGAEHTADECLPEINSQRQASFPFFDTGNETSLEILSVAFAENFS